MQLRFPASHALPHYQSTKLKKCIKRLSLRTMSWKEDAPVREYVQMRPVFQEQLLLHEQVIEAIGEVAKETGSPLRPKATRYAPNGKLVTQSLDGTASYILRTYTGGAIEHMNTTTGVVPAMGLVYCKVTCHAAMDKGTPFLDIEMTGIEGRGVLICCTPTPRLSWLLHPDYLIKYWRTPVRITQPSPLQAYSTTDEGSSAGATDGIMQAETLTFEELERRVRGRMPPPAGFSAPPPGAVSPQPPVYNEFHSASLYTRLASAPGFLFSFDPSNASALGAAREDVGSVIAFWRHWVVNDSAGQSLQGQVLEECRASTAAAARFLQYDPDVGRVERLLGKEVIAQMLETVSGEASLAGPPWWLKHSK